MNDLQFSFKCNFNVYKIALQKVQKNWNETTTQNSQEESVRVISWIAY